MLITYRNRLSTKLFLILIVSTTVPLILALSIIIFTIKAEVEQQEIKKLQYSVKLSQANIIQQKTKLFRIAQSFANEIQKNPYWIHSNYSELMPKLEGFFLREELGILILQDKNGNQIVLPKDGLPAHWKGTVMDITNKTFKGEIISLLSDSYNHRLAYWAAVPLTDEHGQITGSLVVGYWLGNNFAEKLSRMTNAEISLTAGAFRTANSHNSSFKLNLDTLIDAKSQEIVLQQGNSFTDKTVINGIPYLTAFAPITSEGTVIGTVMASSRLDVLHNALAATYNKVILVLLLTFVSVIFLSTVFSHSIMERLAKLIQGAENFKRGHLKQQIDIETYDEIGILGHTLNSMAENLHSIMKELQESNHQLSVSKNNQEAILSSMADGVIGINFQGDIILCNRAAEEMFLSPSKTLGISFERFVNELPYPLLAKNLTASEIKEKLLFLRETFACDIEYLSSPKKILQAYMAPVTDHDSNLIGGVMVFRDITRLRELEQVKNDFVSTVSHELRTPLATIKAYVATLQRGIITDQNQQQMFLETVEKATDRLTRLVSNLLNISRIESGRLLLQKQPVNLAQLATAITEELKLISANHQFETYFPDDFPVILADLDQMQQVLINLLENAVKFSPSGGKITVSGKVLPDEVWISVADQGEGIPDEVQGLIFDKFYRISQQNTYMQGGIGLGLYITQGIIEAHQGRIWVESKVKIGSRFTFSLPLT